MTIVITNDDIFLAILAMDTYHVGDHTTVVDTGETSYIHNLTGVDDTKGLGAARRITSAAHEGYGFFAEAFSWKGKTVIAYRGTDQGFAPPSKDALFGYSVAFGSPNAEQALEAFRFYSSVAGKTPANSNIIVTGQSLGGGLAGLVASVYRAQAEIFSNMNFEAAAANAYFKATNLNPITIDVNGLPVEDPIAAQANLEFAQIVYGGAPWQPSATDIKSFALLNEALSYTRSPQPTFETRLDPLGDLWQPGNPPYLPSWLPGPLQESGERHSSAPLIIRMFGELAQSDGGPKSSNDWRPFMAHLWAAIYDVEVAKAVGITKSRDATEYTDTAEHWIMHVMLAYSAIDEGERPFGDSAIRALYDDAVDLGKATSNAAGLLGDDGIKDALGKIAGQYAGDLVLRKAMDAETKEGIFELIDGGSKLSADLDPEKWAATFNTGATTGGQEKIVGLDTLVAALIAAMVAEGGAGRQDAIEASALRFKADSGETYRNITWLEAAAGTAGITIDEPDNARPTNPDGEEGDAFGNAILIGGDGADTITGSRGHDLILGGKGDDTFGWSAGNDLIFGGRGDDTYHAGDGTLPAGIDARGSIVFFGGDGDEDEADYSDLDKAVEIWFGAKIGAAEVPPTSNRSVRTVMHEGRTVAANDNGLPAQGRAA